MKPDSSPIAIGVCLRERERYRMKRYGATWTRTGWAGFAKGVIVGGPQTIEVEVDNGEEFDRVYSYVVLKDIGSLNRLNGNRQDKFHTGNPVDRTLIMLWDKPATLVCVGYKDNELSASFTDFRTARNADLQFNTRLGKMSKGEFYREIHTFGPMSSENDIVKDLNYQLDLFLEEKRQEKLFEESMFIQRLRRLVYGDCS